MQQYLFVNMHIFFLLKFLEIIIFLSPAPEEHPAVGWHPVSEQSEGARCGQHTESLHSLSTTVNRCRGRQCGEMQEGMDKAVCA